ncbi:MAG: potassium channel family protein [Halobaculum sp.]
MNSDEVTYEPVSVKEVLGEMKDIAELLIDLAYSAVVFENRELATEVTRLEDEMGVLQLQARMSLVMAGRSPTEAEELAPVFSVVDAADRISNAAADVAGVVLGEIGLPRAFAASLPDAVEPLARLTLAADSAYTDRTLGEIHLETETGVRVFSLRRDDEWLLHPDRDTTLRAGDVLLCRGPAEGIERVYEAATGDRLDDDSEAFLGDDDPNPTSEAFVGDDADAGPDSESQSVEDPPDPESIPDLQRAVATVVTMKEASELAVDLAYGSVLFDSVALAREVRELEVEVDALQSRFEAWALRAATEVSNPVAIRGLLRIGASTEAISDAALEISEGVLRGVGSHPVVEAAVRESDEVLVRETVTAGSRLDGTTVGSAEIETRIGMRVVAVRRGASDEEDRRYVLSPPPDTALSAGDVLIAKGTRAGAAQLAAWTDSESTA